MRWSKALNWLDWMWYVFSISGTLAGKSPAGITPVTKPAPKTVMIRGRTAWLEDLLWVKLDLQIYSVGSLYTIDCMTIKPMLIPALIS